MDAGHCVLMSVVSELLKPVQLYTYSSEIPLELRGHLVMFQSTILQGQAGLSQELCQHGETIAHVDNYCIKMKLRLNVVKMAAVDRKEIWCHERDRTLLTTSGHQFRYKTQLQAV